MSETYVVHAKTRNSSISVATEDPIEALRKAREMEGPDSDITISDRGGNLYTVAELDAIVASGAFAKPSSAKRS